MYPVIVRCLLRPGSRPTVAPPTFLERNRRFQNQLPVVSPETRCPSTPRRHRSADLCTRETICDTAFISVVSFLVSSIHETFSLKKIAVSFGGGAIVESVRGAPEFSHGLHLFRGPPQAPFRELFGEWSRREPHHPPLCR